MLSLEPSCLTALTDATLLITDMKDVFDLETEALDPKLLEASASIIGMIFLQIFGKH